MPFVSNALPLEMAATRYMSMAGGDIMNEGFFMVPRSIREWRWVGDDSKVKLLTHIISIAAYKDHYRGKQWVRQG